MPKKVGSDIILLIDAIALKGYQNLIVLERLIGISLGFLMMSLSFNMKEP